MKAITIHQPWAWAIAEGYKTVENRTWCTNYRGQLAIHAGNSRKSLKFLPEIKELTKVDNLDIDFGCIIAIVDLIDCTKDYDSVWAMPNQYHWILANPRIITPIPMTGKLGLWEVDL